MVGDGVPDECGRKPDVESSDVARNEEEVNNIRIYDKVDVSFGGLTITNGDDRHGHHDTIVPR